MIFAAAVDAQVASVETRLGFHDGLATPSTDLRLIHSGSAA